MFTWTKKFAIYSILMDIFDFRTFLFTLIKITISIIRIMFKIYKTKFIMSYFRSIKPKEFGSRIFSVAYASKIFRFVSLSGAQVPDPVDPACVTVRHFFLFLFKSIRLIKPLKFFGI